MAGNFKFQIVTTVGVGDLAEARVVEVAGVAADAGDDEARLEEGGRGGEGVVVDQARRGVHLRGDIFKMKLKRYNSIQMMHTECANSSVARFSRKFLCKFLVQFFSWKAAQQL